MTKQAFNINLVMARIAKEVEPFPKAALFELADEGYGSAFEVLLGCMISIRTYDEVTVKLARRLFQHARTPQAIQALSVEQLDR